MRSKKSKRIIDSLSISQSKVRFGFIDLISAVLQSATYVVVVPIVVVAAIIVPTVAVLLATLACTCVRQAISKIAMRKCSTTACACMCMSLHECVACLCVLYCTDCAWFV